ncbi:unnamed protein product [Camellia sinensis]
MVNTFAVAHVFGGSGINSVVGIQDQILHTCFKSCKACKLCGTSEVHHICIGMLQRLILAVCVVFKSRRCEYTVCFQWAANINGWKCVLVLTLPGNCNPVIGRKNTCFTADTTGVIKSGYCGSSTFF